MSSSTTRRHANNAHRAASEYVSMKKEGSNFGNQKERHEVFAPAQQHGAFYKDEREKN